MGFFRGVKRVLKPLVNFPRWMSIDYVSKSTSYVVDIGKRVFIPRKPKRKESFQAAMARLNLSEEDIQQRAREFRRLLITFILLTIVVWAYAIYLFTIPYFRSGILAFIVGCIAFVQAFRYHFWLFQIKNRELGVTFKQWFKSALLRRH